MQLKIVHAVLAAALAAPFVATAASRDDAATKASSARANAPSVERGRYLVKITGCNDCHTAGYALSGGKVPESRWLMGDHLGWRGPWGTTYAINLRLYMRDMPEDAWVKRAKTVQTRPPMPWFALHDMTEQDLRSIHRYVRTLAPVGDSAPAYVPPNKEPQGPFIQFPAPPK